jgi:uncharacterized membrane protein YjdF
MPLERTDDALPAPCGYARNPPLSGPVVHLSARLGGREAVGHHRRPKKTTMSGTVLNPTLPHPTGLTWQRVVLGDWTRLVRDPVDVLRIVFVAGAVVWGLTGHPVTIVIAASLVLVLALARVVSLPRFYDFSVIVVVTLIAWGEVLGFYDSWSSYDNVVHFTVPLLVTGLIYVLLVRLGVMPELSELRQVHQKFGFFITAVALGMAIGAGWEIVEWTLDETTGSNLVGSTTDTATDLIWDTMGATGSALILVLWSIGNHSLRRRPGVDLAEKRLWSFLTVRSAR